MGLRRAGRVAEAESIVRDVTEAHPNGALPSNVRCLLALAEGDDAGSLAALAQAIDERQPMVVWYRMARFVDAGDPAVSTLLAQVWPEDF